MVTVKSFEKRTNHLTDEDFFTLTLEGGVELVRSKAGRMYATKKTCSIGSTFDEATCKSLVGLELDGSIQRVPCEPFEVTDRETGEIRISDHRWEYFKEGEQPSVLVGETSLVAKEELVTI